MYVLIGIYLLIGILMLLWDLARPITNRPIYLYSPNKLSKVLIALICIIIWPLILIIRNSPSKRRTNKEIKQYMRKSLENHGLDPDEHLDNLKKKMWG